MKNLKLLLFVLPLVILTSCSNDDDGSVEFTIDNLAGTYNIVFLESLTTTTTEASNGSAVVVEMESVVGDTFTDAIITFNEDGTYTSSGFYRATYVHTVTGQSPETDSEIVNLEEEGNYVISTSNRTLIFDAESASNVSFF